MVYILAIVVAQAKKLLYMSDTGRCGPFTNGRQLGWVEVYNYILIKHIEKDLVHQPLEV